MNFKGISYYLGIFCFPVSILAFINILYSSYFDYFLSIESYFTTLILSLFAGLGLCFLGKKSEKKINFIEQLLLIIFVYILISFLISIPFYLSNYHLIFFRYLAICHPLYSYTMSGLRRASKIIAVVWALALVAAIPYAVYSKIHFVHHPRTNEVM